MFICKRTESPLPFSFLSYRTFRVGFSGDEASFYLASSPF